MICCRIEEFKPEGPMSKNRLELLQEMAAQHPHDTFVGYGLAQEYANSDRLEEAVAEFRRLLQFTPDYAAAYFHGGRTLEKLGHPEEARQMYQRGIEACRRIGDEHARSEMQAALDELGQRSDPAVGPE